MPATYSNLNYHIVYSTKGRRPWIDKELLGPLHAYASGVVGNIRGVVRAIGGTHDHVHLLISLPPALSVAEAVRTVKANTSKWVNETKRPAERFEWQKGYSAFTVSQSQIRRVQAYLHTQEEHHRNRSFQQEMEGLLKRHGVAFDPDSWD